MAFKKVLSTVEKYQDELKTVCAQLIQRPSAHPKGRTVECVEYIDNYFTDLGIPTQIYERTQDKPNIVVRIKGDNAKRIMWVGHLDVVPEGEEASWTYPPYSGKITGESIIWGRGASDMKGACAAAMIAARVLYETDKHPNNIDFWFTADEEVGGIDGALWLAQDGIFQGDVCIIGDGSSGTPNQPAIDLGCKGVAGAKLIAKGKTAHGSRPFLGENALDKLLKVIPSVRELSELRLDTPSELEPIIASTIKYMMKKEFSDEQQESLRRLFHYPSITLNILQGGVKNNVIPDYAEAYFDIRLTPGSDPQEVRDVITKLVNEAGEQGVNVEFPRAPKTAGYFESSDTPFAQALAQTVETATGRKPIFKLLTGGTDAVRIKRFIDIPCLGFGSSLEGQSHAPDEHNRVDILSMSAKVYSLFPLIYQ